MDFAPLDRGRLAERIATLGGSPVGTMGANADHRSWDDYSLGRDTAQARLGALDKVYDGMIGDHRKAIAVVGDVDPVTEDILIGQTAELEKFQWFVRAHLENAAGVLSTAGDYTEKGTARDASAGSHPRRTANGPDLPRGVRPVALSGRPPVTTV